MDLTRSKDTKSIVTQIGFRAAGLWDRADYNVVFKNDRVVQYGAGEVRPKNNGVVVIVPVGL
jgi:hypothetical protein